MGLSKCISKAGDLLSVPDREFLQSAMSDGMSDIEALDALQATVEADLSDIADRVLADGGNVATTLPKMAAPRPVLKQSSPDRYGFFRAIVPAIENMNLPQWKKKVKSGYFGIVNSQGGKVVEVGVTTNFATVEEAQAHIDARPEWREAGWTINELETTAPARGMDIWQKIQATAGLKKDEVEWTGLEDLLTADPDKKFTRQQIVDYVKYKGVQYEETVADISKEDFEDQNYGNNDVNFGEGEVDGDSANWEGRADDFMYEWKNDTDQPWFNDEAQIDYIEQNLQDQLIDKYIELTGLEQDADENAAEAMRVTMAEMSPDERTAFVDDVMTLPEDMRDDLEAAAEERADKVAESDYMDNPQMLWSWSADDHSDGINIYGSDDVGYRVSTYNGYEIAETYDFGEAEIRATQHARDEGWLNTEADDTVALWEQYGVAGDYTNYREIKMKLPSIPGTTFFDPHFNVDENLLAFLRVTDRDLMLPLVVADPKVMAEYEAEMATIITADDMEIGDTPPDDLWMNQPKFDISMPYGEWKNGDPDPALLEQLNKNWAEADSDKRKFWIDRGVDAQKNLVTQKYDIGNAMTEAELANTDPPGNAAIRERLDEYYSDEQMDKSREQTKNKLLDTLHEAKAASIAAGGVTTLGQAHLEPMALQRLVDSVNDSPTNFNAVISVMHRNQLPAVNKHWQDMQERMRLKHEIEVNFNQHNSTEQKRERAGKGKSATFYLDEVQSGWHGSQGGGRELGYKTGKVDAGELDDQGMALNREINETLRQIYHGSIGKGIVYGMDEAGFIQRVMGMLERSPAKDNPLVAKVKKRDDLMRQAQEERDGVTNAPFKGDGWLHLALKRSIVLAVEGGYDALAWPNNTTIKHRWSENYNYGPQYDEKMPSAIKKLTKIAPVLVDETGKPIDFKPTPRVDTSSWTVEPSTPVHYAPGTNVITQGIDPFFQWLQGEVGDLGLHGGKWDIKIPGLDTNATLDLGDDIHTPKDAMKELVEMYGKQFQMLEFYDIVPTTTTIMRDGKEVEIPNGLVHAVEKSSSGDFETGSYATQDIVMANLIPQRYDDHFPPVPEGDWIIPITPELRESVDEKGFSFFQGERGLYYPGESENIIKLTTTSDLSTYLHESGHLFLEVQKVWARKYGMDENQKQMLKWLGLRSFDDVTEEHHERWAESFEVYLRTGEAPSLKLRHAFAAFSRWLKKIYRMLTDSRLRRADDGTEIAGIFDRMLATEDEIAEVAAHPEYDKYYKSKEQAGMNDSQWAAYQKRAARIKENAEMTVDEKIIKQYMKHKTAEWNAEKALLIAEEQEQLGNLPIYQVLKDVAGSKADNIPGVPFNTAAVKALYPDGIPAKLKFKYSNEGVDPAEYSEMYGYPSAKAMLDEIVATPSLKVAAQEAAQARMVDKHGDIFTDGTLEAEVREALINDDQAEMLLMEVMSSKRSTGINREYLKAKAVEMMASMKFDEIKPGRFYRAMVKAAQDAVRMDDPTDAKIQQLANHYMYREAIRVREQMQSHRRYVQSVKNRKFDTNKIDSKYSQRMKMLSEMYDMRKSPEQIAKLSDILNFFSAQVSEESELTEQVDLTMLDPNLVMAIEYRLENGGNLEGFQLVQFEDMTAEDLHGVVDMLRHLSHVGKDIATMNGDEAIKDRMVLEQSIRDNGGKDHPLQRNKVASLQKAKEFWGKVVNLLPSIINMTRKLDGMKEGGQAASKILTLISNANDMKLALHKKYYDRFENMVGDMSRVKLSRRDSKNYMLQSGEQLNLSSEEVFMMALYWGTESSRESIRQGHGVTDTDVHSILSNMTQDQLRLVNTIWSMNETHWPELQRAAISVDGYAPPKLEAAPFKINNVEMDGGHMQLFYSSQQIELKGEQEIGSRKGSVMPTKAGSLNARVGSGGKPVNLDINNIVRSVNDKIHFIAFAAPGRNLRRLVNHPDIIGAIERKHGPGFYEAYVKSIESITSGRMPQDNQEPVAVISRWMRQSATMMHLMYSIRNTAQQFSALPIVIAEVGPQRFIWASGQMLKHNRDMVRMINKKSKFMENRAQIVNRDSRELMQKVISTGKLASAYETFKANGFILQTMVDSTVAYPTWLAAYQKGMDDHHDEKRAQIEADSAVGQSVGSGSDMHLGRIFQSNQTEINKTLGIFGSWFNAYYQRLYRSSKGGTDFINPQLGMDAVILPFIAANIAQALIMDSPDEDETWFEWSIKNYGMFMVGTVPLLREIASFAQGFTPSAPISALPKAVTRLYDELTSGVEGKQTPLKTAVDAGRAAASVLKIPGSGQVLRIFEWVDSYMSGEEDLSALSPYQMFVEGADKDDK
jgi:hypothetical protein